MRLEARAALADAARPPGPGRARFAAGEGRGAPARRLPRAADGRARHRGLRPAQVLRPARGRARPLVRGRAGRGVRPARAPTAPARRPPSRSSRATASARAARCACSATTPQARDRRLQERVGIVLQSCGFYPRVTVREAVEHFAKAYPPPRDPTRRSRSSGSTTRRTRAPRTCPAASGGGSTWRWRWSATPS